MTLSALWKVIAFLVVGHIIGFNYFFQEREPGNWWIAFIVGFFATFCLTRVGRVKEELAEVTPDLVRALVGALSFMPNFSPGFQAWSDVYVICIMALLPMKYDGKWTLVIGAVFPILCVISCGAIAFTWLFMRTVALELWIWLRPVRELPSNAMAVVIDVSKEIAVDALYDLTGLALACFGTYRRGKKLVARSVGPLFVAFARIKNAEPAKKANNVYQLIPATAGRYRSRVKAA